jgi:hypothetical protein
LKVSGVRYSGGTLQNFLGLGAVLPSTTAYKDMFGVGLAAFIKT